MGTGSCRRSPYPGRGDRPRSEEALPPSALIGRSPGPSGTMAGRCHSSTDSLTHRAATRRPRPGRAVRRLRDLGRRAGTDALPGAGGGADRDRQRRQRHPVHADRHREEPGRHRRPLRGAGARGADVLHGADQGAGLGEVLRPDRRLRRGERRHADRRRGGQLPGADRLLHRGGAGQHRAARGRRRRHRPGGDGRVPLLRRARPWLGLAGAAARAAAGAVPADVRDARRRHPVRRRPDPAYADGRRRSSPAPPGRCRSATSGR